MFLRDGTVRKLRKSFEQLGQAHELTFSCYQRRPFLISDRTRRWFIDALDLTRRAHILELWAYVIMPEHVHVLLLAHCPDYKVEDILKTLKQSVSRRAVSYLRTTAPEKLRTIRIERSNGRSEFRFWQQGGGYDRVITHLHTAWNAVDYIHNNPVRRGLAACPMDWVWSSARWYAGFEDAVLNMDGHPSNCGPHLEGKTSTGKQGLPMPPHLPTDEIREANKSRTRPSEAGDTRKAKAK